MLLNCLNAFELFKNIFHSPPGMSTSTREHPGHWSLWIRTQKKLQRNSVPNYENGRNSTPDPSLEKPI
jgi:hypothetical protein